MNSINNVTTVTAYYKIPSKKFHDVYIKWMSNFLKIKQNVVFFSETDTIKEIKEIFENELMNKPNIIFIEKSFDELFYWQEKYRIIWNLHYSMDDEKIHNPKLYAVWHEKIKFVIHAIKLNYFNSTKFLWVDVGCFRSDKIIDRYLNFPNFDKIPDDKMLFLNINKFKKNDYQHRNFKNIDRIGGGIYGSSIDTLLKWDKIYDDTLNKLIEANKFAGIDQIIINTIYLDNPDLFLLIRPKPYNGDEFGGWMYLQEYLK